MANAINELAGLNFEDEKWITILRNKLCETGIIEDQDIANAFDDLFAEDIYNIPANIPETAKTQGPSRESILYRLSDNKNVGGLLDDQELIFSPYFSLIFGKNGTGKSTYYKVLKDAFHSNQEIKSNIYSLTATPVSAVISFTKKKAYLKQQRNGSIADFNAMEATTPWKPGQKITAKIKFCDSAILSESLTKKDAGWDVDKFRLGYYDTLRESVDLVEGRANEKIKNLNKLILDDLTILTSNLKSEEPTGYKSLLTNNTNGKNSELIAGLLLMTLPEDFEAQKEKLEKDVALKVSDITTQIEALKTRNIILNSEKEKFHDRFRIINGLKEASNLISNYIALNEKRSYTALDKYQLLFALTGDTTKDNAFITLIKSIAETALKYDYQNYPENIDKCFYCNQDLTEVSKNLIRELHALVNNSLETEINKVKRDIENTSKWIDDHILKKSIQADLTLTGIEIYDIATRDVININALIKQESDATDYSTIKINLDTLTDNFSGFTSIAENVSLIHDCIQTEILINQFAASELAETLNGIQQTIDKAKKALALLNDLDFVVKNYVLIARLKTNIDDQVKYAALSFRGYKTKISNDKSRVESSLVRNNYNQAFDSYTQKFNLQKREKIGRSFSISGGYTKIEPKITTDLGTFTVHGILSEGEAKIYALCDWLTELEFENIDTLIFDDPITSLDHRNIEKITDIIVSLCSQYQVIVFTHNFEFYDKLIKKTLGSKAIEKPGCEICKGQPDADKCKGKQATAEELRKCGNYFKVEYTTQPGKALKDLDFFRFNYIQRIEDLKVRITLGNKDGLSGDLRVTINNYFENHILADIKRDVFKGEDLIHYWNKFKDISDTDYAKLMDIHNKLSGKSVHEPSIETTTELDILDYKTYLNEFISVINSSTGTNPITLMS